MEILQVIDEFVGANFALTFFGISVLILVLAGREAWRTREWLRAFDADDLHVSMRGPKPKLCTTLNNKLSKVQSHKNSMLASAALRIANLVLVGVLVPTLLLALFAYYHGRLDLADGGFVKRGTTQLVSAPTLEETATYAGAQLLRAMFDFSEGTEATIAVNPKSTCSTIVERVYGTFVQVFAVGIPAFAAFALWLGVNRTRQEKQLLDRMEETNCQKAA